MGQEIALEDPSPDAKQSPAVLDSIGQCSPVVIINGLAAILFMLGYVMFGVAMISTVTRPRWSLFGQDRGQETKASRSLR